MHKSKKEILIAAPFIGKEELAAVQGPLRRGWLTQGPCVGEFEKEFARLHGVRYAVATTSCTTALHLALVALGVGKGDEVIVPSFTWVATANVVEYTGATLFLCDVQKNTHNINPDNIEALITKRTKAIIPVHLFGLCADMKKINAVCRRRGIAVVEDAACAVGSSLDGIKAGAWGDIGCFSFHPRKIITTGEGGMCTTKDKRLYERMVALRNHGATIPEEYRHLGNKPYLMPDFPYLGYNYRMTDLQAAVGVEQLKRLNILMAQRLRWAAWYRQQLSCLLWLKVTAPAKRYVHSYQSFVCYVDERRAPMPRNQIMEYLYKAGISTRPGTIAVHMQDYYVRKYGFKNGDFPVSRDCAQFSLALPLHNRMTLGDYQYVVRTLKSIPYVRNSRNF